jgi:hypothetical protein
MMLIRWKSIQPSVAFSSIVIAWLSLDYILINTSLIFLSLVSCRLRPPSSIINESIREHFASELWGNETLNIWTWLISVWVMSTDNFLTYFFEIPSQLILAPSKCQNYYECVQKYKKSKNNHPSSSVFLRESHPICKLRSHTFMLQPESTPQHLTFHGTALPLINTRRRRRPLMLAQESLIK